MELVRYRDVKGFADRVRSLLLSSEAENHLMLGILSGLLNSPAPPPTNLYLATVEDGGTPRGAALMTPPQKLVVTQADDHALALLAEDLLGNSIQIPAVVGPSKAATSFAEILSKKAATSMERGLFMLIYQLDRVERFGGAAGKLRPARMEELGHLSGWGEQFVNDTGVEERSEKVRGTTLAMIREGRLYVWEDGGTVTSMAAWAGETPNGARINYVYTPPEFRRRGYGTSCVSALCKQLLGSGKRFCFLFADLASPASNSIYRRIGFEPVCEFREYRFY
jgi:uncharacterized protein